jgi:hypothetical protein
MTEPIPLDHLAALRSPSPDIQYNALRDFIRRMGLSLQPMKMEPPPPPPPKPKARPASSPVSPLPKRQYQKTKDREFKHAVSHGVRHSYQPYIREISTPDWAAITPCPSPVSEKCGFDIRQIHGRLEFFEHRIINGHYQQYRHPAQCLVADDGRPFDPSSAESEKVERYLTGTVTERIPRFWPERSWDRECDRMTDEETKRLEEAIAGPIPESPPKPVRSAVKIRSSGGSPRIKKTSMVMLDFHDYQTDESEDETDWDDF